MKLAVAPTAPALPILAGVERKSGLTPARTGADADDVRAKTGAETDAGANTGAEADG